jgi:hypothetical protein
MSKIDEGLLMLRMLPTPPRGHWNTYEIAAVCECTPQAISKIERQALRHFRDAARRKGLTPDDIATFVHYHTHRKAA